ncbi:hypothetical protein K530_08904 [Streptomyces noursei CCRC 11814]|uniref:Uncharacterized protein n=1 Tax=Streptomyces noursei TaxID=1971 RepID=A0A401QRG4_STRNR|nr:hypothetical protein [Streptomyces noursei]EOT04362.2 hypothetical protein K530_08904 [Streptomyces noursei CCRC 11814]GCB88007.1 hypothetical protein SALB_00676 [Streptomyces noursei]
MVVQPADDAQHAELAVRLRAAGLKRLTVREWQAGLWPLSRCSVTVAAGHLEQMHTGRSRVLCRPAMPVAPTWQAAADRGRVLLALVQPGTLDESPAAADMADWSGIDDAVRAGLLLGGLAEVRATAEPYGRRW